MTILVFAEWIFHNSYLSQAFYRRRSENLGGHDTMLLDMVRAHSNELEEAQDKTLDLPRDDISDE